MKTSCLVLSSTLLITLAQPGQAKTQEVGISVLNSAVIEIINDEKIYYFEQGQTIIIALNDTAKKENLYAWIRALEPESVYTFNENGLAFVGIGLSVKPGEYSICLFTACNSSDRKKGLRIKVLEGKFEKTRTSSFLVEPNPRTDRQKQIIDRAYAENIGTDDLTMGISYANPIKMGRDIIDPFGFIYKNNPYRTHLGIDLRAPVGTPVMATNRGKVILVAKMFRREGNMVIISHGLNIFSIYMHLSKFSKVEVARKLKNGKITNQKRELRTGDMVERGQVIGLSGTTGAGAGREKHLHYGIRIRNAYVNPSDFLNSVNIYLK